MDLRHLVLKNGVVDFANGSALIERVFTKAKAVACVKLDVTDLSMAQSRSWSRFSVSVDCTSLQAGEADASDRRYRDFARLQTRLVEAQLAAMLAGREGLLDIIPGKYAWTINVDVVVLGADGSLPDLISLAVLSALSDTALPRVETVDSEDGEDFAVDSDPANATGLPAELLQRLPIRLSLHDIGGKMVADVSEDEELCADSSLSVLVNRQGNLCSSHIAGKGRVPLAALAGHLSTVCQVGAEIFKLLALEEEGS